MDEAAADKSYTSDDSNEIDSKTAPSVVPMEMENDGVLEKEATTQAKGPIAPKPTAVASGLPQSKEELESLISTIHQTVNDSVLPRLHKCLTAKVHTAHTTDT